MNVDIRRGGGGEGKGGAEWREMEKWKGEGVVGGGNGGEEDEMK